MRKLFALMKGEEVLEKSRHRGELVKKRDILPGTYVCTFIGRVQIAGDQVVLSGDKDE